jgi:hypothetical protein
MLQHLATFLYHIAPALIALFGGSLILQKFFVSRANESNFIDALIKDLDLLRTDALKYWSKNATQEDKEERQAMEQQIVGTIKALTSELQFYAKRYCPKRFQELEGMATELNEACTGGDFQTTKRKAESGRTLTITNCISRIKSTLRQRKL